MFSDGQVHRYKGPRPIITSNKLQEVSPQVSPILRPRGAQMCPSGEAHRRLVCRGSPKRTPNHFKVILKSDAQHVSNRAPRCSIEIAAFGTKDKEMVKPTDPIAKAEAAKS